MEDLKQAQNQLEKIGGGGDCTPADILGIIGNLTIAYEGLVDFTSHVIDRVITGVKS